MFPRNLACISAALLLTLTAAVSRADQPQVKTRTFVVRDTLAQWKDPSADAQAMLEDLRYKPESFDVRCATEPGPWDALIRFPSPAPQGNPINDTVVMEWHAARDSQKQPIDGPAVLVLHALDGNMGLPRVIAKSLASAGIHGFVIHLPCYGQRRPPGFRDDGFTFLHRAKQAVGDTRRARDVIAALPHIQKDRIGIQGSSMGSFITSVAAAIDGSFQPVFMMLSGGDLYDMFQRGQRESAAVRAALESAGYKGAKLKALAWQVEPLRLAHRLPSQTTWLYSAADDQVVPAHNANALARAAKLPQGHHVWIAGDHVTCAVNLPWVIQEMIRRIKAPPQ